MALGVHKLYMLDPPHDVHLYDTLEVFPNATMEQISKSYRRLSRKYHPDKRNRRIPSAVNDNQIEEQEQCFDRERLQQIQRAYEVLSNDSTRLPYHKYGLVDPSLAVVLLMGPRLLSSGSVRGGVPFGTLDRELLLLMGYDESTMRMAMAYGSSTAAGLESNLEQYRVKTIAAILVEQIRPLVEGRIDLGVYSHELALDCDRWKRLPLGAQIIRCVGRAYYHTGDDFLKQYHSRTIFKGKSTHRLQTDVSIGVRKRWREAKHYWTAALASGRLVATAHVWNRQQQRQEQQKRSEPQPDKIGYFNTDDQDNSVSDIGDNDFESLEDLEEEAKAFERARARQTLLQLLQVEALWKVSKIDLDKTVRKACAMILSGEYFFFPSDQSFDYQPTSFQHDVQQTGWVTSSGITMDVERARVEAAKALVWTGRILVNRSKEGTSWKL
jgi:curved DNA-binding protein CbpA